MADNQNKPGIFSKIQKFFSDQRGEMKKISWPSRKHVINNTVVVIGVVCAAAVVIGAFDALLAMLLGLFLQA